MPTTIDEHTLASVRSAFEANFEQRDELGASLSIWHHGKEILNLAGGHSDHNRTTPWTPDSRVLCWSATKGPASACVLHSLQSNDLNLQTRVAQFWPDFAAEGKADITVGQLLSHQAGLPAITDVAVSVFDHPGVAAALAAQKPLWEPGTSHGYHPRTFGYLLDEVVRRLNDGMALSRYWRETFTDPLELDFWIGVPEDLAEDVAMISAPRSMAPPSGESAFYRELAQSDSLSRLAFTSPKGLVRPTEMNAPEVRMADFPGFGGIGTAQGLATFYAMLAGGGTLDGEQFFEPESLSWMTTTLCSGLDKVLHLDLAFAGGFFKDPLDIYGAKTRRLFGTSRTAFGHPGAGGSHAFADPEHGISFAYVMNQMELGILPNARARSLVNALYAL